MAPHIPPAAVLKAWQLRKQWQRRQAIRLALPDAAFRTARRFGASYGQAKTFAAHVKGLMRRTGSRPKSLRGKTISLIRGGPVTVVEWPESREWEPRAKELVCSALREFNDSLPGVEGWSARINPTEFADVYVKEVKNFLAEDNGDETKLGIHAELVDADRRRLDERASRFTVLRVTSAVLMSAVIGAGIGHVVNVEAPLALSDAVEMTIGAAVGAAIAAAASSRARTSRKGSAVAAKADALRAVQQELREQLRHVVNGLIQVVNPSLRAPPLVRGQPLTATIETAAEVLRRRTHDQLAEVELTLDEVARRVLDTATEDLVATAEHVDLVNRDQVCAQHVDKLAAAVNAITSSRCTTWEGQIKVGEQFWQALVEAWCVADRLEVATQASSPPYVSGRIRLDDQADRHDPWPSGPKSAD